ncbi:MAG: hypothetical protein IPP74_11315 [Alphaproteobacteria bacterium]|nr:hypothetical protein [Alphaproteobacteria bacterium]
MTRGNRIIRYGHRFISNVSRLGVVVCLFMAICLPGFVWAQPIPRVVIGLYNGEGVEGVRYSPTHRLAEMPLNQLGLTMEHYDIRKGLPNIKGRHDVRGVITWFSPGTHMGNPADYLKWASEVIDSGKKFVIIGDPGFYEDKLGKETPVYLINQFLAKIGLRDEDEWVNLTYHVKYIKKDLEMVDFERLLTGFLMPYQRMMAISKDTVSHLVVEQGDNESTRSHLVVSHPNGGYVADNYGFYFQETPEDLGRSKAVQAGVDTSMRGHEIRMWYINPFVYFGKVFQTDNMPRPDVTTIAGRRIYYSHIDGDGWNNISSVEEYRGNEVLSSEVVMEHAIKAYPDLPVTVSPIAADIDTQWVGTEESRRVAKELLALPQVEVATHTYSHPYEWEFFEQYSKEKESPYMPLYRRVSRNASPLFVKLYQKLAKTQERVQRKENKIIDYEIPRAFADKPFDLANEIKGSVNKIKALAPADKPVTMLMWSGNTAPFKTAFEKVKEAGLRNINGGDSRYDREYPSYGWVAPVGIKIGDYVQVYSSNSNENTYTDLWTGRFHGFRFLITTLKNTEFPMRVKPLNIYYHMYSGEKDASLIALEDNFNYAMANEIAPIEASLYAGIIEGFYHLQVEAVPGDGWLVKNRGDLQTIRFDKASMKGVDFSKSKGIIGERHYQGSLYIYLDAAESEPVIYLKALPTLLGSPTDAKPYLISSRWLIHHTHYQGKSVEFTARGYGLGEMQWSIPQGTHAKVSIAGINKVMDVVRQQDGTIRFWLPKQYGAKPIQVKIEWL